MVDKVSPAMRYLFAAWTGSCTEGQHSWRRVNDAMQESLHVAIKDGMRFYLKDFAAFEGEQKSF